MFNGILFQQSLQDLVKGIRAHRRDEDAYVRSKIAEIGEECRSSDIAKKTTAVLKLSHLQMMGYSIAFASFHIVEIMSCPDFSSKRIGYLTAAQSFSPTTDVLLLTTNQFKKDLTNGKVQDCSQALTCLGKLVTEELGRDLEHDVSLLLNSPRPYIRKKALLVLYRLIMVHPETLPVVSARFRDRLADSDPGVVCAAVTVTCELARASPRSFLSLAPVFYQLLMNKESNNWMLIKIVKLMGVLTPLEPRLGKKLVEPLITLMRATRAKSLLYECCNTITIGLMAHPEAVEICAQHLGEFMEESDQNLKYLGLQSMRKLIQAHPQLATDHRDDILDCLDDEDVGIRMRALDLVSGFITTRTLRDISRILLRKLRKISAENFVGSDAFSTDTSQGKSDNAKESYLSGGAGESPFREALARQLLRAGQFIRPSGDRKGGYELLTTGDDFAWYMTTILGGLAAIPLLSAIVRDTIGDQLLELTSRVDALRRISISVCHSLLALRIDRKSKQTTISGSDEDNMNRDHETLEASSTAIEENDFQEKTETSAKTSGLDLPPQDAVLSSNLAGNTAWILGEYCELIEDHLGVVRNIVAFPKRNLTSPAQTRLLTTCVKVYTSCTDSDAEELYGIILSFVNGLTDHHFAEVQERAWFFKSLLGEIDPKDQHTLAVLFEGKLIPVDHRAQSKVPISAGLDLESPLLNTGSDSLYSYLLKTIGNVDEDEEIVDDEYDLFKEALYSGEHPIDIRNGGITAEHDPALSGLPHVDSKKQSPYYLEGPILPSSTNGGVNLKSRHNAPQNRGLENEIYFPGQTGTSMTSEAAVILEEYNPLGLNAHDEGGEDSAAKSISGQEKFHAAFEGAFESNVAEVRKKQSRRKKHRAKDMRHEKGKSSARPNKSLEASSASLIDLEGGVGAQRESAGSASKPKHMADALLM